MALFSDFVKACLYDLAALSFVALIAGEVAVLRLELDAAAIKRLGQIDVAFAFATIAVFAVGCVRFISGPRDVAYYIANWIFWIKIGVFALIAFLSTLPRRQFSAWLQRVSGDPKNLPTTGEIGQVKRVVYIEAGWSCCCPFLALR